MFNKPTIISITGPSASGKNFLRDQLEEKHRLPRMISTTTRPMRPGELDGHDYYFISEEQSRRLEADGEFLELNVFGKYRYGPTVRELEKLSSGKAATIILDPNGVERFRKVCQIFKLDLFTVYVSVTESKRLERLTTRMLVGLDIANRAGMDGVAERIKRDHEARVHNVVTNERCWLATNIWDAVVPGDDLEKAIAMIECGATWRNKNPKV